jgi:hypothetical protein
MQTNMFASTFICSDVVRMFAKCVRKRPPRNRTKTPVTGHTAVLSYVLSSSSWHTDHGYWAVDTHNPNYLKGVIKGLGTSTADIYLAQEAKCVDSAAMSAGQRAARVAGRNLSIVPALRTDADGVSAGVAMASKVFHGMTNCLLEHIPELLRSRIGCVHSGVRCRGGIHFLSVHLWCSEGLPTGIST